jgi:hypothetical protein
MILGFAMMAATSRASAAEEKPSTDVPAAVAYPAPAAKPATPKRRGLSGAECAQRIILLAAKKNVANLFDNRSHSSGTCAFGVRTSLKASHVGGVDGSLGNAVDFLKNLKPHGFVDNGNRNPNTAPPGSVLILIGKKTGAYFRSGGFGKPAGDWLGHVTIKGDDGRYYTDGRTPEPALGWENGKNVEHRRNMAAIYVPGPALAEEYEGRCSRITVQEQIVDLSLAASEVRMLPIEAPASRETGKRLVVEGKAILARTDSSDAFGQALRLARESSPYDDEGELVAALADRAQATPARAADLEKFLTAQPIDNGNESCKTKVFESEIRNAICNSSGSQDSEAACPKIISWNSCKL